MVSRRGLAIDGVLLLDKPEGMSSNHALQAARRLLNARKAGHTGTLDPFAAGLMVLCFGEATKFSTDTFAADKAYEAILRLGAETDTGDHTGQIVSGDATRAREWLSDREAVAREVARFRGRIRQVPPMYSALKRDGKPLYRYAREGVEVEREAREVTIYELDVLHIDEERCEMGLRVACSKGTYIRTLAQDIGQASGAGAHLTALRRITTAGFRIEQAVSLETLEAHPSPTDLLLPLDSLLVDLPEVTLAMAEARRYALGQTVPLPAEAAARLDGLAAAAGEVGADPPKIRVYAPEHVFLGTAERRGLWLKPHRSKAFNKEYFS